MSINKRTSPSGKGRKVDSKLAECRKLVQPVTSQRQELRTSGVARWIMDAIGLYACITMRTLSSSICASGLLDMKPESLVIMRKGSACDLHERRWNAWDPISACLTTASGGRTNGLFVEELSLGHLSQDAISGLRNKNGRSMSWCI